MKQVLSLSLSLLSLLPFFLPLFKFVELNAAAMMPLPGDDDDDF
jgi:hypothetical protein